VAHGALWGDYCLCCCFSVLEFAVAASKTDPPDVLDRQKCLAALAEQRRSKWFQVCSLSSIHFSVLDVSRIKLCFSCK